jgi:hypothetical protein
LDFKYGIDKSNIFYWKNWLNDNGSGNTGTLNNTMAEKYFIRDERGSSSYFMGGGVMARTTDVP